MTGIYSADSSTDAATDFISALNNPAPSSLLAPVGTETFDALRKMADIFQGKITGKAELETTET